MTTLLVVDDEPLNRDALQRRLARVGYRVLTADSGAAALEIASAQRVDLVLLDVMMPGIDGIETLRRLRQSRSLSELPVIMVTAKDGSDDVIEALDAGANDYITKPVDFAVAQARIRTQLTARRADPLTGLPNRLLFMDRLSDLIERSRAAGNLDFAVFFIDIDRFKVINDSLGHVTGDELLMGISRRLEQTLRGTDTVARFGAECTLARLGGDEFTVLLAGVRNTVDASTVAERLIATV
ncbi:MAG TPA: response regulator, partial [Vicinamibacterales bacterium]|nr:response regulator [Vicinamibacterales bacterium]